MERVADIVKQHGHRPMSELVDVMYHSAADFGGSAPQQDDITIVVGKVNAPA